MYLEVATDAREEVERLVVAHLRQSKNVRIISHEAEGRWSVLIHDVADEPAELPVTS